MVYFYKIMPVRKLGKELMGSTKAMRETGSSPSVCESLTHSVSDVLGADTEVVEQLVGLSAAGNARHRQTVHNDARL
uniref:Uncharacterized protein n=1 Tax=Anguilla anguilla TaxID=7936 RepID=A0A0E9SBM1_ANGAN